MYQNIEVDRTPPTVVITINRPNVLNALNDETLREIEDVIDAVAVDDEVRVVILTGAGNRAFAAGADISGLQALSSAQDGYAHSRKAHMLLSKFRTIPKPVIAAVNGYALGGGCELAMAADIILASENAKFGQPEVNLGIIPGFGGTQRLPRLVGRAKALEMIFTGEHISAQDALAMGLVNRVVPGDQLLDTARSMAATIAAKAPLAISFAKRAVYEGLEAGPEVGNEIEMTYFGLAVGTQDRKEGTSAFLEKRTPEWRGM